MLPINEIAKGASVSFKYWAFISYSHRDKEIAKLLHTKLEKSVIPNRLIEKYPELGIPKRLFPIFRDEDELPTSAALGTSLTDALKSSSSLIVLCSKSSANSRWVNEEIKVYKTQCNADRIFCVILDGEPNATDGDCPDQECFPLALRHEVLKDGSFGERVEPIAADIRDRSETADALLKLTAGIVGVGFDELKQRDLQRKQSRLVRLLTITGLTSLLMLILATSAIISRNEAVKQTAIAEKEYFRAEQNFQKARQSVDNFFVQISQNELFNNSGMQSLQQELLSDAVIYYQEFLEQHADDPTLLLETSKTRRYLADISVELGKFEDAEQNYLDAIRDIKEELGESFEPVELVQELADQLESLAVLKSELQDYSAGIMHSEESLELANKLLEFDPNNAEALFTYSHHLKNLPAYYRKNGQVELASKFYEESLLNKSFSSFDRATAQLNYGILLKEEGGDRERGMSLLLEALKTASDISFDNKVTKTAGGNANLYLLASTIHTYIGVMNWEDQKFEDAYTHLQASNVIITELTTANPLVVEYHERLGMNAYNLATLGQSLEMTEEVDDLFDAATKAFQHALGLSDNSPMIESYIHTVASSHADWLIANDRGEKATEVLLDISKAALQSIAESNELELNIARAAESILKTASIYIEMGSNASAISLLRELDATLGGIESDRADIDLVKVTQLIATNLKLAELSPRELQGRKLNTLFQKKLALLEQLLTGHEAQEEGRLSEMINFGILLVDHDRQIARDAFLTSLTVLIEQGSKMPLQDYEQNLLCEVYGKLGWIELISMRLDKSIEYSLKGIEMNLGKSWIGMNLATAYLYAGDEKSAVEIYKRLAEESNDQVEFIKSLEEEHVLLEGYGFGTERLPIIEELTIYLKNHD